MKTPELSQMEAELASPEPAAVATEQRQQDRDDLHPAVAGAVSMIAMPICARYRLTPLDQAEIDMAAGALLNLANVYGLLDKADPKIMAWLTVTGVGMSILGNRRRLPPPPEPVKPADADATQSA